MRFYSLKIGGNEIAGLNSKNQSGIRITFNLTQYDILLTPNATIGIYNLSRDWYQIIKKLKGKKLELYAGIQEDMITKAYGIQPNKNNLLLFGYIYDIYFNPNERTGNEARIQVIGSATEENQIAIDLKNGSSIKKEISNALKSLYSDVKVSINGLEKKCYTPTYTKITSLLDLREFAKNQGVDIILNNQGFIVKDVDENNVVSEKTIKLIKQDFLEQPVYKNYYTIQMTLALRGDLKVGNKIEIPNAMFATFESSGDFFKNTDKTYIVGTFQITAINHVGDSRNISANAWATNVEAIQEGVQ